MGIVERLKIIQDYSNLSVRAFAIKCSLKQQTLDKQLRGISALSGEVITAILDSFPEISAEWLLRGEGNMLKSDTSTYEPTTDFDRLMKLVDTITTLQEVVNTKSKTIATLKERIAQLENKLKAK